MTDTPMKANGRAARTAPHQRPDGAARRVEELEAENAALRRALARADRAAPAAAEAGDDALRPAEADLAAGRAASRERDERRRLVLDSATDYAIIGMDPGRRVTSWNEGAERLTGWAEGEIVGRSADGIFTPEDRGAGVPEREAAGALRDGRAVNERWHLRKDGSRFWGSGLVTPLRDPAAGPGAPPLGLLKVMRDGTEQRRAEEALRARERRLRLLAGTAAGLLAAADPDEVLAPVFRSLSEEFGVDISFSYVADDGEGGVGGLRLASCFGLPDETRPAFERLALGEALCGRAARDRRAVRVADARASDDPAAAALRALGVRAYAAFPLVAGGGRLLGTISFGSRTRARFSEEEAEFLGAIAHHVAVVRERLRAEAALREGERRLRATQDQAGVGIHELDAGGRYLRVNGTFTRMTGYTMEDFAGRAFWEFIEDEAGRRHARGAFGRLVRGEIDRFSVERPYTNKHGRRWWAEVTTTAVRDERGRLLYAVRVVHDATERRRAEERLREVEARQTFLLRLGDALRPLHDAADIQAEACRLLGEHLGVAQVGFGLVDDAQERVAVHRDWNDGRVPSVVGAWRMDDFGPAFVTAMKRGETAAIPDIALDPRTNAPAVLAAYAGIGTRAVLDVPLVKGGRMAAMLFIHHPEPRLWSAADVEVVEEACGRLWEAVERARAEAALRDSEARFRELADNISQFAWTADASGSIFWYNKRWFDYTGTTLEEMRGWGWREVQHPDHVGRVVERIRRCFEAGEPWEDTFPLRGRDGRYRWFLSRALPIRDGAGRVARWFGTNTDITAQRGAEEALRRGEARWRGLFERMREGFALCEMVYDAQGRAVDYRHLELNDAWGRLTGVPNEAVQGRLVSEAIPGIEPYWLETYARVVETGEPAHFEHHLAAYGRWFEVTAYRTEPGRFAAVFSNVTERKRAEARRDALVAALRAGEDRLRLALEAGRLGAWELDVAAESATRSPRHDAIFGYEAEPPPGWGFEQFMRHVLPEDRARVERSFRAAVEGGTEWHFECRIRRAGGEARWIEARGQPVRGADGRPVRLLGVVADITERKRAEERRALLVNELNHRVKNTLAVVQSLAAQTARGAADLPSFSAAFQARLIALARAHDLLTRQDWEGAPLGEVARAALEPSAGGDGGRVDLGACASDAVLPPAQALALALALHELATNALKHGALSVPEGRVAIACRADPGEDGGARVVEWAERGGPPVPGPPARRGFGLRLLERGLATQAGVRAELRFEPEGLRCTLRLPAPPRQAAAAGDG